MKQIKENPQFEKLTEKELEDVNGGYKYESDSECYMFYERDSNGNVYGFVGGWYA